MKIEGNWKSTTVYAILHLGEIKYVGKSSLGLKARINSHWNNAFSTTGRSRNTCPKLYEFFRNHPNKDEYEIRVLGQYSGIKALEKEVYFIAKYKTNKYGLNISAGGNSSKGSDHYLYGKEGGCPKATAASVAARIGKPLTDEHKRRQREGHLKNRDKRTDLKPVICDQTGQKWDSVAACKAHFGVDGASIYHRMRFKDTSKFRKTSALGEYTFSYG